MCLLASLYNHELLEFFRNILLLSIPSLRTNILIQKTFISFNSFLNIISIGISSFKYRIFSLIEVFNLLLNIFGMRKDFFFVRQEFCQNIHQRIINCRCRSFKPFPLFSFFSLPWPPQIKSFFVKKFICKKLLGRNRCLCTHFGVIFTGAIFAEFYNTNASIFPLLTDVLRLF